MSESGRLSRKLDAVQRACSNAAILEARRLYGGGPCDSCGTAADPKQETPLSSDVLEAKVTTCFSAVIGRQVGPESARTDELIQRTLDAYADPANPDTRFVAYRGPYIPPVCPPIPTEILNANIPKSSKRCPLPNKGYNPNLPA
jgi:hypothetical protein